MEHKWQNKSELPVTDIIMMLTNRVQAVRFLRFRRFTSSLLQVLRRIARESWLLIAPRDLSSTPLPLISGALPRTSSNTWCSTWEGQQDDRLSLITHYSNILLFSILKTSNIHLKIQRLNNVWITTGKACPHACIIVLSSYILKITALNHDLLNHRQASTL